MDSLIFKQKILLLFVLIGIGLSSCKKGGCTDKTALNFSAAAEVDDGSCQKLERVKITGVTLKVLKPTDDDGIEWDAGGYPDCFVGVSAFALGGGSTTITVSDVTPDDILYLEFDPVLIIDVDSIVGLGSSIMFTVFDDDSGTSQKMADATMHIDKISYYGSSGISDFHKRWPLMNLDYGNWLGNHHVSMVAHLEWE